MRDILVEAARTQLAAVTAATTFWAGWAKVADAYAQGVSKELARLDAVDGETVDLAGRVTDLTRQYMREVVELPTAAVTHFNSQLEQISTPAPRRRRAARAKD